MWIVIVSSPIDAVTLVRNWIFVQRHSSQISTSVIHFAPRHNPRLRALLRTCAPAEPSQYSVNVTIVQEIAWEALFGIKQKTQSQEIHPQILAKGLVIHM